MVIRRKSSCTSHRQSHFDLALYHIFLSPLCPPCCIHCAPPIHHFVISLQHAQYRNHSVKPSIITSSVIALYFTFLGNFPRIGRVPFRRIYFSTADVRNSSPLTIFPHYSRSFSHRVCEECRDLPFPLVFIYSHDIYSVVCWRP